MEPQNNRFLVFYSDDKAVSEFIVFDFYSFLISTRKFLREINLQSQPKELKMINAKFNDFQCKFPMTEFDSLAKRHATDPSMIFASLGLRSKHIFSFCSSYLMHPVFIEAEQKVDENTGKKSIFISYKGLCRRFRIMERVDR